MTTFSFSVALLLLLFLGSALISALSSPGSTSSALFMVACLVLAIVLLDLDRRQVEEDKRLRDQWALQRQVDWMHGYAIGASPLPA